MYQQGSENEHYIFYYFYFIFSFFTKAYDSYVCVVLWSPICNSKKIISSSLYPQNAKMGLHSHYHEVLSSIV